MSKAILVMDMPESCLNCPLSDWANCRFTKKCHTRNNRPDYCPLKPMPEYDSPAINPTVENTYYAQGWNDCIDEILKGGAE